MPLLAKTNKKVNKVALQISPEQKELLDRAASLKGLSLNEYILYHSLLAATTEIETYQKLVLSDRDRDLFLSLIATPPPPSEKLKLAMQRFQNEYESEVK